MNSTKNATEMTFTAPTRNRPSAAAIARPQARLISAAMTIRHDRSASHRMMTTAVIETAPFSAAWSVIVTKWSSLIGTMPVSRTRA